jgi:hypothetical protein
MKTARIVLFLPALLAVLTLTCGVSAQTAAAKNPFQSLSFLEGTWEAKTNGDSGVDSRGAYAFALELRGHILSRHTISKDSCKGPADYNCDHSDLLYIYPDGPQGALRAIYFDNEGHVIKYDVSTPSPTTAVFISDESQPGPQFRLVYERKGDTMFGKFQIRMPGQSEWKPYLEWSGGRK